MQTHASSCSYCQPIMWVYREYKKKILCTESWGTLLMSGSEEKDQNELSILTQISIFYNVPSRKASQRAQYLKHRVRLTTTAEDTIMVQSCQPRARIWGYHGHWLTSAAKGLADWISVRAVVPNKVKGECMLRWFGTINELCICLVEIPFYWSKFKLISWRKTEEAKPTKSQPTFIETPSYNLLVIGII